MQRALRGAAVEEEEVEVGQLAEEVEKGEVVVHRATEHLVVDLVVVTEDGTANQSHSNCSLKLHLQNTSPNTNELSLCRRLLRSSNVCQLCVCLDDSHGRAVDFLKNLLEG